MSNYYAVRLRSYAAAHFEWSVVNTITWHFAEAKLQSEYTGGDDGRAYAVTIHGEIRERVNRSRRLSRGFRPPLLTFCLLLP